MNVLFILAAQSVKRRVFWAFLNILRLVSYYSKGGHVLQKEEVQ